MPRIYRRPLGIKERSNYSKVALEQAISDVKTKKNHLREAADYYNIPKSTLNDNILGKHSKTSGGQTKLSKEEEEEITHGILTAAAWGFPLTRMDIRKIVKTYLDRSGKMITSFKQNKPGLEWFYGFMKRNKPLTERLAQNIKRCRAEVDRERVKQYFENPKNVIENTPPENIVNYDESNLTDGPGKLKVVCKKGTKHINRIIDSSKSSTSIMMAATASGVLLPPYVVYRALHIYPTWMEGGPEGTVYNRTKSGWFESPVFEDWFLQVILPYFRRLDGQKILIGDHLSSHLSLHVIKQCEENNIHFTVLPPNATHLLQPLDVAFFGPMKRQLRAALTDWKLKNKGVLPKSEFPRVLKNTLESLGPNIEKNLKSGFKACGIVPLNAEIVLEKLPGETTKQGNSVEHWSKCFADYLKGCRWEEEKSQKTKRGKKLNVSPGKGVRREDLYPNDNSSDHSESICQEEEEETDNHEHEHENSGSEQPSTSSDVRGSGQPKSD